MAKFMWAKVTVECPSCKTTLDFDVNCVEGNCESECEECGHKFQTHINIEVDQVRVIDE